MNSGKAMNIWIAAYFENLVTPLDGSFSPIAAISAHFDAIGVTITEAQIRMIVDPL
jgi:hypothetical protein